MPLADISKLGISNRVLKDYYYYIYTIGFQYQ